jgi:hypothetical protein
LIRRRRFWKKKTNGKFSSKVFFFFIFSFLRFSLVLKNKQKNTHDDEELDPPGNDKQCTTRVCIIKKEKERGKEDLRCVRTNNMLSLSLSLCRILLYLLLLLLFISLKRDKKMMESFESFGPRICDGGYCHFPEWLFCYPREEKGHPPLPCHSN